MRKILIGTLILGTAAVMACDDKASTPAPAASAAPVASASAAPSAATSTTAAPPKAPEGPKNHEARMKALAEAYGSHDAKKVSALYTEDAVVKFPNREDVKGRAAIEKDAAKDWGFSKDAKIAVGRIWAKDKHTAVVEWVWSGKNTGEDKEMGIDKATDKPMGFAGATWVEVSDNGFIKEEHRYFDSLTGLGQIKPDPKTPVRPVVTEPAFGTKVYELKPDAKPDEAKNLDFENKWATALSAGKLEELIKLADKDPVMQDYTEHEEVKGEKPFKAYLEKYLHAFPDMKATMTQSFSVGEFAIVEYEYKGTHKGALGPIKATNKTVDIHQVEVDEIKDGKFVRGWAWGDSAEMLKQLGLLTHEKEKEAKPAAK